METLLTASLYILVIGFAALMALDFVSGLLRLFRTSASAMSAQVQPELKPLIAVSTQPEPRPQVVPGWDVIERERNRLLC